MKTVLKPVSILYTDRGSKFFGYLYPVGSQQDIDARMASLTETYPDATHHCYAYRFDPESLNEFAQDDGEPGGTAGLPILNALKSAELINVLAVAVRYFGGTKLGKAGLIHAYRTAAERSIEKAEIGLIYPACRFRLTYPYSEQKRVDQIIHSYELQVTGQTYMEDVAITIECEASRSAPLKKELQAHIHLGFKLEDGHKFFGVMKV